MGRQYELEKILKCIIDDKELDDYLARQGRQDFDLGVEIALLWIDKLCEHLAKPNDPAEILQSVKTVFKADSLLLLYNTLRRAEVIYSDIAVPSKVLEALLQRDRFYGRLAEIRFTHFFDSASSELASLPAQHPKVYRLLAVPVFYKNAPSGCLALIGRTPEKEFTSTHAMVLSLAASVLSVARAFDELKEELE
jgi:hypothetical protein